MNVLTFDDKEKAVYWHTTSHIMAQAVKRLFPGTKLAIGPAVDNGFYYDFDAETPFSAEDLNKIEDEMQSIIKEDLPIERFVLSRSDALKFERENGEIYKTELISELPDDAEISFYRQGEFTDLCAGPHLPSTGRVKAVKLTNRAGAYWRGNEKNKMLQRIYGVSFPTRSMLDEHLRQMEEAKKRDHNKVGRELELFMTSEPVGQGLPLLMPKGAKVFQILQRFVEDEEERRGYVITKTRIWPKAIYIKYRDTGSITRMVCLYLGMRKRMTRCCSSPYDMPIPFMIYNSKLHSYRIFP